jgi:hypothetical protein
MIGTVWVQTVMEFQVLEKRLPFAAKAKGNIAPKPFNTNVVNAPERRMSEAAIYTEVEIIPAPNV